MLERTELGVRMHSWHSSMWDPIYMVGSLYYSGDKYPDKDRVQRALDSLQKLLDNNQRMLAGEKVSAPTVYGSTDDLRKFAGYDDGELIDNIEDLTEIVESLENIMEEDYAAEKSL